MARLEEVQELVAKLYRLKAQKAEVVKSWNAMISEAEEDLLAASRRYEDNKDQLPLPLETDDDGVVIDE